MNQPHNRLSKINGQPLPQLKQPAPDKMKIVKLALTGEDVAAIKHVLRQTIEATRLVMRETKWPAQVRVQRQAEIDAMERALTTIVEQEGIST